MLALEVIEDSSRLQEISREWFSFVQSIEDVTPFQLPQWQMTWWAHFGSGRLHVMVFRHSGGIAAIIPAFRHPWNGRQQLTLVGSGISDYLEPAIHPGYVPQVLDGLRTHLGADSEWEICDWQDLSVETPLKRLGFDGSLQIHPCSDSPCSEIRLTGSFEEFWRARPKQLRQNFRRDKKRAEMTGPLELAIAKQADPELLDALIKLHTLRWQECGQPGVIAANGSEKFLRDLAHEFARLEIIQFFYLRFRGKIAAVILSFVYANRVFFYLSGFDPEHALLGLGRILLGEALRHCFEKRYDAWNFLRGNEHYKFQWGAQAIPKCRLLITRTA